MAHPYNQSQHVYINITGERGAGTDIQPNLFYGYDIPATDFIYSGGNYPVQPDWAYSDFEYPSGSFFPALTEYYPFDARNPTGIFVGAKFDIATLETSWTGRDYGLYLDYPSNDHRITGLFTGLLKETADVGLGDIEGKLDLFSREYPSINNVTPSYGNMYGYEHTQAEGTMAFLEGELYKGRIRHEFVPDETEKFSEAQFFFITGRYQGGIQN